MESSQSHTLCVTVKHSSLVPYITRIARFLSLENTPVGPESRLHRPPRATSNAPPKKKESKQVQFGVTAVSSRDLLHIYYYSWPLLVLHCHQPAVPSLRLAIWVESVDCGHMKLKVFITDRQLLAICNGCPNGMRSVHLLIATPGNPIWSQNLSRTLLEPGEYQLHNAKEFSVDITHYVQIEALSQSKLSAELLETGFEPTETYTFVSSNPNALYFIIM